MLELSLAAFIAAIVIWSIMAAGAAQSVRREGSV
jgi:hypothetical protein